MQTISSALRNAINNGTPQRALLVFNDREFSNEDIVLGTGISINEEFNSAEDLTIGTCPSSIIQFTLLNDRQQLSNFNFGWFNAYLGAMVQDDDEPGESEIVRVFTEHGVSRKYIFAPLGIFYAEKPTVIAQKKISVTAYDQMIVFESNIPNAETLGISYPTTIGAIMDSICTIFNVTFDSDGFMNADLEVESEPEEFQQAKTRDVIGWIAECACSIARFTREGHLEFAWFTNTGTEFTEHNYSAFSPAWYETNPINGLYLRDTNDGTESSVGASKTNNYLIMNNPFLREV